MDILKTVKANIAAYNKALKACNNSKREATKARKMEELKVAKMNLKACFSEGLNYLEVESIVPNEVAPVVKEVESIVPTKVAPVAKEVESIVPTKVAPVTNVNNDDTWFYWQGYYSKYSPKYQKLDMLSNMKESTDRAIKKIKEAIKIAKRLKVFISRENSFKEKENISYLCKFIHSNVADLNAYWTCNKTRLISIWGTELTISPDLMWEEKLTISPDLMWEENNNNSKIVWKKLRDVQNFVWATAFSSDDHLSSLAKLTKIQVTCENTLDLFLRLQHEISIKTHDIESENVA